MQQKSGSGDMLRPGTVTGETRISASNNQTRYVKAELSGVGTYMIPLGHLVQGAFDEAAFKAAAKEVVRRHDALRTRFEVSDGSIYAVVSQNPAFEYHVTALSDQSLPAFREWALPLVFANVDPLGAGSLIRFLAADYGTCWRFTIAAHHAITDGFSRGVMNKELLKLYAGETLPPAQSYYIFSQTQPLDDAFARASDDLVSALPNPMRLAGNDAEDDQSPAAGRVVERSFEQQQRSLRALGKSIGATQFGVLTAAYALGLHGYSGEDSISSFFQTEGRKALGAPSSVVGPFSNTLPLDLSVDLEQDFAGFARALSAKAKETVALENSPVLDKTLAAQKAATVSINMFPPTGRIAAGALDVGPREFLDRRTEYDLNLVWSTDHGVLNARAFYNAAQVSQARAQLFLDFQTRLLDAAIEAPHLTCRQLLSKARSSHQAVVAQKSLSPEPEHRIHESFFDWAERAPDTPAIYTSKETISYQELAERARCILGGLQQAGVKQDDRVVIFAQRHPDTVAAMLAVAASGASFALIDATYPVPRIQKMMEQIGTRYVVEAGATFRNEIAVPVTRIIPLSRAEPLPTIVTGPPRDAAYHLFTSGTTGQPKFITHPDKTLQRFISWQHRTLALPDRITTVMMAGLAHDPMLRDIFLPLSHGGTIAIPTPCEMSKPDELRSLISKAGCNVVRLSPSSARLLMTGITSDVSFGDVRALFWGGERLPKKTVEEWRGRSPNARQFNVFGTTETPQAFLIHEIGDADKQHRDVPLGKPLPYNGVRLVAQDGSPVSIGEIGEIVAELADPVAGVKQANPPQSGAACEHFTGDIGYLMQDGVVYLVGRRDHQVKINGFRVELGEIEAITEAAVGVTRACALMFGEKLFLFALTDQADTTDKTIRATLFRNLPAYMMPTQIVTLSEFPFTANGKIDTDALVANLFEAAAPIDTDEAHAEPLGTTETGIAAIFVKHSGRKRATRDQSLFDLGADSLSTIEARLDLEALGIKLPDEWQWLPISELAGYYTPKSSAKLAPSTVFESSRIETFVLIRCLAIVEIVAFHTGFQLTGGMSIVLFALAGYSFSRLQLPAIIRDDHAGRVWALLGRLLIPLVPVTLIYLSFTADFRFEFDVKADASVLFFYRNLDAFIDIVLLQQDHPYIKFFWLWFLHVYLQMFFLIGILLCIPEIRRQLKADPWRSLAIFSAASEVIGIIAVFAATLYHGDFREVATLLHTSPFAIFPFLAIGALVAAAKTRKRQMISFGFVLFQFGLANLLYIEHSEFWWVSALLVCTMFPYVTLPRMVSKIVATIAASSLMIYLLHTAVGGVFSAFAGDTEAVRIVSIVIQILSGVILSLMMRPVFHWLGIIKIADARVTFKAKSS